MSSSNTDTKRCKGKKKIFKEPEALSLRHLRYDSVDGLVVHSAGRNGADASALGHTFTPGGKGNGVRLALRMTQVGSGGLSEASLDVADQVR